MAKLISAEATLIFLAYLSIEVSESLYCLECTDKPSARDCNQIKKCGPHEVCYSTQVVASTGHIYREMGCRDTRQCTSGVTHGKRKRLNAGDIPVCDGCCDSLWCQFDICMDTAPPTDRGHICFNCDGQLETENCTKITECGRDSVCYESYHPSPSGTRLLRETGCFGREQCTLVEKTLPHTSRTCWNCCDSDLCNTACDPQTPPTAPTSATINISPTKAGCVDGTPSATCQLAASIVCLDAVHATNANCSHYCGFC